MPSFSKRHQSGHMIVRHNDDYCVLSIDGDWTLARLPSMEDALAWCDARFAVGVKQLRRVLFRGTAQAVLRTEEYQGSPHLVVPVIALVGDHVIHPVNAPTPEFVPTEVLATAPQGWNGRPCVGDHPQAGAAYISANDPRVLEQVAFGQIFHAADPDRVRTAKRLELEGWLNPSRARALGAEAADVIARVEAGETIEVSVGAYVTLEERSGEHDGQSYGAVWTSITPDHLAFLPRGAIGACSVEAGCGAPRAAMIHVLSAAGLAAVPLASGPSTAPEGAPVMPNPDPENRSLRTRLFSMFSAAFRGDPDAALRDADLSDVELRGKLHDALRAVVPGFDWIAEVRPTELIVFYSTSLEDSIRYYRRGFAQTGEDVTVNDDAVEVERVQEWKEITAAGAVATPPPTAACACGHVNQQSAASATGGAIMHRNSARIAALITNQKTPWAASDQAHLEAMTDERLAEVEIASLPEQAPAVAAAAAVPALQAASSAVAAHEPTEEEQIAALPKSLRSMVLRAQAQETAKKTGLVSRLKAAQQVYSEAELQVMPIEVLERTAKLVDIKTDDVDFSVLAGGLGGDDRDYIVNPPNGYKIATDKRRAARGESVQ